MFTATSAAPVSGPLHSRFNAAAMQPATPVIRVGTYVRKIKPHRHTRGQVRRILGYGPVAHSNFPDNGQGIAGTPYRSGLSKRFFKSKGIGFSDGLVGGARYSERHFKLPNARFKKNFFGTRPFRSSGPRFKKNFFGSRAFKSSGFGFGF
jgi:hypothetical protein